MHQLVRQLQQAGISELALQFAKFIGRMEADKQTEVVIAATLLSEAVQRGHVCLDLAKAWSLFPEWAEWIPQNMNDWIAALRQSVCVGEEGDYKPMLLTDEGQLYLYRYWQDECTVARDIQARCQPMDGVDMALLKSGFDTWQSNHDGVDWQKVAAFMAVTRQFSVISGGPGTGKTTVIAHVLDLLQAQSSDCHIMLAAPTGKAAARMQQVLSEKNTSSIESKTIHRLLGITPKREQGKYNAENPLSLDVLIIDEASMIDISLMAQILAALPTTARLILLGDSRQLASVESGAVLDSLCRGGVGLSAEFMAQLTKATGLELKQQAVESPLQNSVVMLQHSYRFAADSVIGKLANMTLAGDADSSIGLLKDYSDCWNNDVQAATIEAALVAGYQPYIDAISHKQSPEICLAQFERYRLLSALRKGPQSVASANTLFTQYMRRLGWRSDERFYHGQAIMVTQNNYQLQLFNGDAGLILNHPETGDLQACFMQQAELKWVLPIRLPAHETAFAMTVHKAQGAEFERVDILLPEQASPLLSRELLYTAVTRAKKQLTILADEATIRHTIATQHQRESGLADRFKHQRV